MNRWFQTVDKVHGGCRGLCPQSEIVIYYNCIIAHHHITHCIIGLNYFIYLSWISSIASKAFLQN